MPNLCKLIAELIGGATPTAVEEQQTLVVSAQDLADLDPDELVPPAKPQLTMFERAREYYAGLLDEVYCSSEEYKRQEEVHELARKYDSMSSFERAALRTQFETALRQAIDNQRTVAVWSPARIRAAKVGQFNMQECIKDAARARKNAERELRIIFGTDALNRASQTAALRI